MLVQYEEYKDDFMTEMIQGEKPANNDPFVFTFVQSLLHIKVTVLNYLSTRRRFLLTNQCPAPRSFTYLFCKHAEALRSMQKHF